MARETFFDSALDEHSAPSPHEAHGRPQNWLDEKTKFPDMETPKEHDKMLERLHRQQRINMGGRLEDLYKDGFVSCITSILREKERAMRAKSTDQTSDTKTASPKTWLLKKIREGLAGYKR